MFKNLFFRCIHNIYGRNIMRISKIKSRLSVQHNSYILASSVLFLVPMYKYSDDIFKVIDYNNEFRNGSSKIISSKTKINDKLVENEVVLYVINAIQNNDISKLQFISESELNNHIYWDGDNF